MSNLQLVMLLVAQVGATLLKGGNRRSVGNKTSPPLVVLQSESEAVRPDPRWASELENETDAGGSNPMVRD